MEFEVFQKLSQMNNNETLKSFEIFFQETREISLAAKRQNLASHDDTNRAREEIEKKSKNIVKI